MYNDNDSFERTQKSGGKVKIFFLLILIILIGGGIFYYYNKDEINSYIFSKKTTSQKENTDNETEKNTEIALERSQVEISTEAVFNGNDLKIIPSKIEYDESTGYKLYLTFESRSNSVINGDIKNVSVDEFQLDHTFSFYLNPGESKTYTIDIPLEFLDLYLIEIIQTIDLRADIFVNSEKKYSDFKITIESLNEDNLNELNDLTTLGSTTDFSAKYYKVISTETTHSIYLFFENKSQKNNYTVKILKMFINDKIYDAKDFSAEIKAESKKMAIINVPKSEFKNIKNLTFSFFLINNNDIYTIKEKTIKNVTK